MNDYIKMSKYAGMREDLVQAGGGNSSYKISENEMLIKASGYQMADIDTESGFAVVNPQIIKNAFLNNSNYEEMTEEFGKELLEKAKIRGKRPSIETFLHAISDVYTLHTHPIVVNILAIRKNGFAILKELFPEALFIKYATPGINLAKEYFNQYLSQSKKEKAKYQLVFLKNHGMVVSDKSADEVIELTEKVLKRIEKYLSIESKMEPYHRLSKLNELIGSGVIWRVTDENVLRVFQKNHDSLWKYTFCPDCTVFLGKEPLILYEGIETQCLNNYLLKNKMVSLIIYKNTLYIHASSVKKALEVQSVLSFSAQVMECNEATDCDWLSDKEQNFLLNWEMEKYRKNFK